MNGNFLVGEYLVQPQLNQLVRAGQTIPVEPKVMEVLVYLASQPGEVVSKNRLLGVIWSDVFVTEDVLKHAVFELRRAFGDDARQPRFIQTVRGRGYRLIAPVDSQSAEAGPFETGAKELQASVDVRTRVGASSRSRRYILLAVTAGVLAVAAILSGLDFSSLRNLILDQGEDPVRSVAVLPLSNLSNPSGQDYFADGIHDALIAELGRFPTLRVISRQSVVQYRWTEKTIPEIAGELGVDAVIQGSTIRDHGRVRISLQLFGAEPERQLWAETYERDLTNVLRLQSDVARDVAVKVGALFDNDSDTGWKQNTSVDPQAYDYYLRGNDYFSRSLTDRQKKELAIQMYEKAIQIDPDFALAHARLSEAHIAMWHFRFDRSEQRLLQAKTAVEKALELQPDLTEGHRALGYYYYWGHLDYRRAAEEFSLAEWSRPGDSRTLVGMAGLLRRQGKFEEALTYLKRSLTLNPRDDQTAYVLGTTYETLRDSKEADHWFDRCIELRPDDPNFYAAKARIYIYLDAEVQKARDVLESASELGLRDPQLSQFRVLVEVLEENYEAALATSRAEALDDPLLLAQIHELMGKQVEAQASYQLAREELEARTSVQPEDAHLRLQLAFVYAGLGRKEDALRAGSEAVEMLPLSKDAVEGAWLLLGRSAIFAEVGEFEKALDELEHLMSIPVRCSLQGLVLDPTFRPLHDHPRFQGLVRKYGR